ncbi:uncharacterized protein LOC122036017 [Zingiber officinale]|uniref:Uncharacterized protein n=1 Tax=Zingiber officinale TaxID=94328 RepID=A0A8J5ESK4_ZINOF|nr:uncharacterized protein LOC122036017 [Zingiber officinale]KAG6466644.1 hypothetical protein ZIOFF_075548 [Zingiber officinale]
MLCSISRSTSTADANSNSTSDWLQRLHSSRGLSVPLHYHLDHFLSSDLNPDPPTNTNPNPNLPAILPPEALDLPPTDSPLPRKKHPLPSLGAGLDESQKIFDLVGGVLAELFVMEGPAATKTKKIARKQSHPRVCIPSVSASIDGCREPPATSPPSSADNSVAEAKNNRTKMRRKRGTARGSTDLDLSACSRTDVTVIDTSHPGWKSEKVIFRNGIMWKVRDKKVWNLNRKKRRLGLVGRSGNEKEKEQPPSGPKIAPAELSVSLQGQACQVDI